MLGARSSRLAQAAGGRLARRSALRATPPPCPPPEAAAELIGRIVAAGEPALVARFGTIELEATLRRLAIRAEGGAVRKAWRFLRGDSAPFWWDERLANLMATNAGFFPAEPAALSAFGDLMLAACPLVDVLGAWQPGEALLRPLLAGSERIALADVVPYLSDRPWSQHLEGRTVLVVHPFEATIRRQYNRRELLFADPRVLPAFELRTLRAVQSIAGSPVPYATWFDALRAMEEQMAATEFDVALVGAGAYGFPLAAAAKRLGKVGIHMGGALQILFGIRGRRWDEREDHRHLFDEHWVRPLPEESVAGQERVEGACYW